MEILSPKPQEYCFDILSKELKLTQTSLFLLNYTEIFTDIINNFSTLTFLATENLSNTYLYNKDVHHEYYSDVIYLVFNKFSKYEKNIEHKEKECSIIEVLEDKKECLDLQEDEHNFIFTYKPKNKEFSKYISLVKNGELLKLPKLDSYDNISTFINNLIDKKGLYSRIKSDYNLDIELEKPFLAFDIENEIYDSSNFKSLDMNDLKLLKKFS